MRLLIDINSIDTTLEEVINDEELIENNNVNLTIVK